jgi:hypothetical protein
MLKKREAKLENKKKSVHTPEDKKIIKQVKNNKREKRRDIATEEDEFDSMFKNYTEKLSKRLKEPV